MSTVTGKVKSGLTILGMGLGLYWSFSYSGPYRYLAELQLKQFGSYSPKLTLLLICLLFYLFGELAGILLRGAERPVPGSPVQTPPPRLDVRRAILSSPYRPLLIPAIPFVMGAYFYMTALSAGSLRELQIADFADSALPSRTLYSEVHGYPASSYVSLNHYLYVPLRESRSDSRPVRVLVGVDETKGLTDFPRDPDGSLAIQGMLHYNVENEVRYAFEKHGVTLAAPCRVLHTARTPASDEKLGAILMLVSIVIGVFWSLRLSHKTPKSSSATRFMSTKAGRL